ncbi:MAG: hypothetical protein RR708_05050 [Bacilli bacterium]
MEINMKKYNLDSFQEKDLYSWEEIISILEEQDSMIKELNNELEELNRDVEDNYKPISYAEQVGISDNDFI